MKTHRFMVFTICLSLSFLLAGCSSDCDDLVAENETYGLRSILTDAEINSVNEQLMRDSLQKFVLCHRQNVQLA